MTSRYRGALAAPEWPAGLDWLNTARPLTLNELRGKIVLLEFWTSNCVNCRENSAALARVRATFPHETMVIGVHSGAGMTRESLRQAVMRADMLYPIVDDPQHTLARLYNVTTFPIVTLLDPLGGYVLQEVGPIDPDKYCDIVKTMVADYDRAGVLERKPLVERAAPAVTPEEIREPQRVLKFPSRLLVLGHRLYLADTGHHRIVEIQLDADGRAGEVLRVFGSGRAARQDGAPAEAAFAGPHGLASDGQRLFVADTDNHSVRSVALASGQVTTLVSPQPGSLSPRSPWALALHGDLLFIAMAGFHQVWVLIEPGQSNQVGPFVGNGRAGFANGTAVEASFNQPRDLVLAGPALIVADTFNHALRRITWEGPPRADSLTSGLPGDSDGPLALAKLSQPGGLAIGPDGRVAVSDSANHKLKLISQGQLSTFAGTGEPGLTDGRLAAARFHQPDGLAWGGSLLYVADAHNHAVRVLDPASGTVSTLRLRALERLANTPHRERPPQALDKRVIAGGPTQIRLNLQLPPGYRRHPEVALTLRTEWYGQVQRFKFGSEQTPEVVLTLMQEGPLYLEFSVYYSRDDEPAPCYVQHANLLVPLKVDPNGATSLNLPYRVYLELP